MLTGNPALAVFLVASIGGVVARLRLGAFSAGIAGVLFAGIAVGALVPSLVVPDPVWQLGLAVFVYTIGLASGPSFRGSTLSRRGLKVNLLVVGAPTQIMGLSKPNSRASAAKQATTGVVSQGIGLREWLDKLPADGAAVPAAAFDTRLNKSSWLTGSAARSAEKTLRKLHHPIAVKAESFLVAGTPGPLLDGEVERARAWGEKLGASLAPAGSR